MSQYDGYLKFGTRIDNRGFESGVSSMTSAAKRGARLASAALAGVAVTIGGLSAAAIKVGSDFEEGMSKVSAISGATGKDLGALTAKAEEMGAKTKFTATQSAEALQYMAMAGWKTEDMLDGLDGIMNLAAASGEDLGLVSDIVTDALTAFGLAAKDSAHFADVLAKASSNSNTNVSMMGQTFKYAAPIAGALGYSIEDTAVAIGLMANAGIKADQAGTSLRSMMTRLSAPPKMAAKAIDELNISITNADGTMKPFSEVMEMLRGKFAGLSQEQQVANAKALAGQEAMSGLLAIVNASQTDFDKLTAAVADADGAAEEMAETMQDNLKGQLTILGSALEGLGIKVYDKFEAPMRAATKSAIKDVNDLTASMTNGKLSSSVDKLAQATGNFVAKAADLAANGLPKMINGLTWIIDHGKLITSAIGGATAAVVAFKAVNVLTKVTAAWKTASVVVTDYTTAMAANNAVSVTGRSISILLASTMTAQQIVVGVLTGKVTLATAVQVAWNAAMAANPIGIVVVAVAALTAGLLLYNRRQNETLEKSKESIKAVQEERDAWEDRKEAVKEQIETNAAEVSSAQEMLTELERLVDANGKVGDKKERVRYLTDEINKVAPDSIHWIDDETIAYDNNTEAIRRQLNMKQAQISLEAMEADRTKNKKEMIDALDKMRKKEEQIAQAEKELAEEKEKLSSAVTDSQRYYLEKQISEKQKALNNLKDSFSEEKSLYEEKGNWLQQYSQLAEAIANENYDAMDTIMAEMNLNLKDAKNANEQELKDQIQKLSAQYDLLMTEFGTSTNEEITRQKEEIKRLIDENKAELEVRTSDLGSAMTQGIAAGVYSKQGELNLAVESILNVAVQRGRKSIESNSPSRLTARVIGLPMAQGVAAGIQRGAAIVYEAFSAMSLTAINRAKSKAKSYRDIGTIYVDEMTKGINHRTESAIKAIEKLVDDQIEAEKKARNKGEQELQDQITKTKNKNAKKQLQDQLERLKTQNDTEMKKLKEIGKEQVGAYTQAVKDTAKEQISSITETVGALADEFQKKYDDIISKRDSMKNKLSDFGDLFKVDEDGDIELTNWDEKTSALDRYHKALTALKDKGAPLELLNEAAELGVEEGTKFIEKLLQDDETFQSYVEGWNTQRELSKEIAAQFYQDQLDTLETEFADKLDTSLADVPNTVEGIGKDAMQGFIDGMNSKMFSATAKAREIARAVIAAYQEEFDIHSPSKKMERMVGKPVGEGFGIGMEKSMREVYAKMRRTVDIETSKLATQVSARANFAAVKEAASSRVETYYQTNTVEKTPVIEFKGDLAGFAKVLEPQIRMREKRLGGNLIKGGGPAYV